MAILIRAAKLAWAGPNSLLGLALGSLGLLTGGSWQVVAGVVEFHGGALRLLLSWVPLAGGASALALGHVILAQNGDALASCRAHEQVHVRQYERWGPLFLPAYFGASLVVWLRGGKAYRDNPFEVEAYREAPGCEQPA